MNIYDKSFRKTNSRKKLHFKISKFSTKCPTKYIFFFSMKLEAIRNLFHHKKTILYANLANFNKNVFQSQRSHQSLFSLTDTANINKLYKSNNQKLLKVKYFAALFQALGVLVVSKGLKDTDANKNRLKKFVWSKTYAKT